MPQESATISTVETLDTTEDLNSATNPDSGFMSSIWSTSLLQPSAQNEALFDILEQTTLSTAFGSTTPVGKRLDIVANSSKNAKLETLTHMFLCAEHCSFDNHSNLRSKIKTRFAAAEMEAQSVLDRSNPPSLQGQPPKKTARVLLEQQKE